MQKMQVCSLGWDDHLEKEMATHASVLAWKILWAEEPGRLQSPRSQRFGRQWHSTPVLLPGKSLGQRSLVGYSPRGHKESDTTEQLNNNNPQIRLDWGQQFQSASSNSVSCWFSGKAKCELHSRIHRCPKKKTNSPPCQLIKYTMLLTASYSKPRNS